VAAFLELSFDLGSLDAHTAESAAFDCGALAVTLVDARDHHCNQARKSGPTLQASLSPPDGAPDFVGTAVFEPPPGATPLWPATRVKCLFDAVEPRSRTDAALVAALAARLGIDPALIEVLPIADRVWEREWLKDFHALRFGRRLWVCPHHERVSTPEAVVVALDPGLAFGTGRHASTALCLEWLDAHLQESPAPAEHSGQSPAHGLDAHLLAPPAPAEHFARVIDYGCGSGVLGIAAARLGADEVHAFDIDPQALLATAENARANGVQARLRVHASADALPRCTDVLLANILSTTLCALAPSFAALVRPAGEVVLAGLMEHEAAEVTAAYATCFDVVRFGERDGWVCLAGKRR
jgi:ribosomal protein L11 methyltransferase